MLYYLVLADNLLYCTIVLDSLLMLYFCKPPEEGFLESIGRGVAFMER
jgi:hypothetical protein